MEIHELNTFSGTLGSSDFFATDNGNDTSKVSAESMFAPLNARIDNIIAGPAPSAEEIIDARLGADGVTYPSLGDAIRDQVSDLKSYLSDTNGVLELQTKPIFQAGFWSVTDGTYNPTRQDYVCTKESISVKEGDKLLVTNLPIPNGTCYFCEYDSSMAFLQNVARTITQGSVPIYTVPNNVKYIKLDITNNDASSILSPISFTNQTKISLNGDYLPISNVIKDIYREISDITIEQSKINEILETEFSSNNFQTGFWANGTGEYNGSRSDYVCTNKMIPVTPGDTVTIKNIPFSTGSGYFVQYDSSKAYINPNVAYAVANSQFSGIVASGVSYLHIDLTKNSGSLNPNDFANVSIIINGVDITKNAIERLEDEISGDGGNGFVIGSDFLKESINTSFLGSVTYGQSFCVYDGKYYSTDGQNIGVQDSNFVALSTKAINVGHGNSFQLGNGNIAYISGWSDNNVYAVNMDTLTVSETISLGTTGYTTAVIDERNALAYIFQRDSYPDTVTNYNFIVYDYQNRQVLSTKVINAFGAMQAADYYNGKIIVVWGLGTDTVPSGMAIYNTNGDTIAEYNLDIFANSEPEGVCFNRDTNELLIGIGSTVYKIAAN